MKIIGLGHYSRTGKDTFANYLIDELQARGVKAAKMPFAWKLKQIAHDLYAWDGLREPEFYETPEGAKFRDVPLPTIGKTPVQIWIDLGTPAVRNNVYPDTWIDYVLRGDHGVDVLVTPDCRFDNEVNAIKGVDGKVIKVVRPGYGPRASVADQHLVGYEDWDYVIGGSGQMQELAEWARIFAMWLAGENNLPPYQSTEHRTHALAVEEIKPWTPPFMWQAPKWYPKKYILEAVAA